jgi:hypothetical protein
MNLVLSRHNPFNPWLLVLGLGLCALILAKLFSSAPPATPEQLWIRFEGLSTNQVGGWDCTVAVPKPEHHDAVILWSLRFEETNKACVAQSAIVQAPSNGERDYGPKGAGIVACGYGPSWETGKVYRVIGYYQPGNVGLVAAIRSWSRFAPAIQRLLPQPTGIAVTSQWTEVTALMKPF